MASNSSTPSGGDDDHEPAAKRQKTADAAATKPAASPTHLTSATASKSGPGLDLDTTITAVDPDGDLILHLGSRSALRVSSSVLKLASPVFRTMLGPHFREGQNIKDASAANPMLLPLPDTQFDAMRIICETLHYKEPSGNPVHETFREIATLVDYYDLASSMRLQNEAVLKNAVETLQQFDYGMLLSGNAGLLYCARILDTPEAFKIVTKDCILRYVGTFLELKDADGSIDTDILVALEHRRNKARSTLVNIVNQKMAEWFDVHASLDEKLCRKPARCASLFLTRFATNWGSIWPHQAASVTSSYKYWQSMPSSNDSNRYGTNFDFRLKRWLRNTGLCFYCVYSEEFANYLRFNLTYAVEDAFNKIDGLCLDCVRNGGKPLLGKECRIPHNTEIEDDGPGGDYDNSDEW